MSKKIKIPIKSIKAAEKSNPQPYGWDETPSHNYDNNSGHNYSH